MIQSENFVEGQSGFRIRAGHSAMTDGGFQAEFDNVRVRGHIDATSGELNNITIKEEATFLGTVDSGPVFISNENTAPVAPTVFNAGTNTVNIRSFLGGNGTFSVIGIYGNRTDLVSIVITTQPFGWMSLHGMVSDILINIRLIFSSGTDVVLQDTGLAGSNFPPNRATIPQQLSIGGSRSGKTFIIRDLPTGGAGLSPGTVYRIGNQLMVAT